MYLDIGNTERIDDPSAGQISHYLRHLPAGSPFLILIADDALFLQATPDGAAYRVEWRQEGLHRFMVVPVGRADELLQAFRCWDEAALSACPWRRLRWFDPRAPDVLWPLAALVWGVALIHLWSACR